MLRKIVFSLIIGLFSIVTIGSGIYVMCNEISTSLSQAGGGTSQEELDENKKFDQNDDKSDENDKKDENNGDLSTDDKNADIDATYYYDIAFGGILLLKEEMNSDRYESLGGAGGDSMFSYGSRYTGTDCYSYVNAAPCGTLYSYNLPYGQDTYSTSSYYSSCTVTYNVSYDRTKYRFLFWRVDDYNGYGSDGGESAEWNHTTSESFTRTIKPSSYYPDSRVYTDYVAVFIPINIITTYTVRYYYETTGGTNTYIDQTCEYGQTYNYYSASRFTFYNYTPADGWQTNWVGWATSSSTTSYSYSAGSSFSNLTSTNGGIVYRYAILRRECKLNFDGNDGSLSSMGGSYSAYQYGNFYGTDYISSVSIATGGMSASRTGYTFSGWGTSSSGGTRYNFGASVSLWTSWNSNATQTLYAQWSPITYTVRYNYWGTSGDTYTTQTCTYDTTYSFLTASSFNFNSGVSAYGWQTNWVGWANSSSSTAVYYSQGANFSNLTTTNGGIVNLYALLQRSVSVAYNGNTSTGGSTETSTFNYQYGNFYSTDYVSPATIEVAQNGFTKTGYNFTHWSTSPSGGSTYNQGAKISLWPSYSSATRQNLYANWSLITHNVTIYPYMSDTNGLNYVRGVPESYRVTLSGGTSPTSITMLDSNSRSFIASVNTGYKIEVVNELDPDKWQLMGIYTYETTPTSIQSNPIVTVSDSEDTNVYIYFARSSANKLQYDKNLNYFYFEDGYFPQSRVADGPTSGSASGRTYNIAGISYAGYIVGGQEYVNINNTIFKVEPIIWRVSDYGVSETDYPEGFDKFGAFSNNITAVSDKVLNVGSALTREQFKNTTWNNWSMVNSSLPSFANEISVNFARSSIQNYDKFGGVGNANIISGSASGTSSNVRIASKKDLENSHLTDYDGRASDLVKYLLGCGTYANYWTTNLGSQYGAGQVITTGNLTKDIWLYEKAGLRFAMTFNESVRQSGDSNTYRVVVKELYDSAEICVYNQGQTDFKVYNKIENNQIVFDVEYDYEILIRNITRTGYINKNFGVYITGTSGTYYYYESGNWKDSSTLENPGKHEFASYFKNLNNNNGVVTITPIWTKDNAASNYYDKFSFSYNHNALTASILAVNTNISGEIVIPDVVTHPENEKQYTITKVKGSGFQNCKNITSVILPDSITEINSYAFSGCTNLKEIKLSKNLTSIDYGAFSGCSSLQSIRIPSSVTKISSDVFGGCTGLKTTYYEGTLAQWATIDFRGSTANPIYYSKNLYINEMSVTDINLASSNITSISRYAFYNFKNAVSLALPTTIRNVGDFAFAGCENLAGTFPTSMTSVGAHAFENCKKLTGTVGPLSTIGNYAFSNCAGLTDVTLSSSLSAIGSYAFAGCSSLRKTNYEGTLAQWAKISFMSQSANPIAYTHNLYINGSLVINLDLSGVTSISDHAFFNLTCATSLTLPSTLTRIGDAAFKHCARLTGTLTIPNSVTTIGESAFFHTGFNIVNIGSGVKSIASQTFGECRSLTGVKIGSAVTSIGDRAFRNCVSLKSIYIPSSVITIESNTTGSFGAFNGCSSSLKIYCGRSSKPTGYGQYWDTYYYQNAYTDSNGYHPVDNRKLTNIYWGYTYVQYQNATAGGIAYSAASSGTYNGVNFRYESNQTVVLNGNYFSSTEVEIIVLGRTGSLNLKKGQEIILETEYLGGEVSGGGRVIFMWRLFDSNGNKVQDSDGEITITKASSSFKNVLLQDVTGGQFVIALWRSNASGGNPQFNNARFKITLIV